MIVYYADLLSARYYDFLINSLAVHRFLISATVVVVKEWSDTIYDMTTYARIGVLFSVFSERVSCSHRATMTC